LLPAGWGIVTGTALWRLKEWARISIIAFSVLLLLMGGIAGLMSVVVPIPVTPNSNVDPSVMTGIRIAMGGFCLLQFGIGIWWLVFFTRAKVKAQFVRIPLPVAGESMPQSAYPMQNASAEGTAATGSARRPVSITILAWLLLAGCFFIPLSLILHAPAMLFTKLLTGSSAVFLFLAFAAAQLWIGVGLLRLKPAARVAAIVYFAFGFVNSSVFFLAPGAHARAALMLESERSMFPWMRLIQNQPGFQVDMTPFFSIGAVAGLIGITIPLYFLITRKFAFDRAARRGSQAG